MTSNLPDISHQTPGADVTAIREDDRITILGEIEFAIRVRHVKPPKPDTGQVYVSGPQLNPRGKPYARGSHGLTLTGPAGGTWDWWRTRKPIKPERTGRHRLMYAFGDHAGVYRTATDYAAKVSITCAPDTSRKADLFQDPSIELTVHPDGRWILECRQPGVNVDRVLLASGHIDNPEGSR